MLSPWTGDSLRPVLFFSTSCHIIFLPCHHTKFASFFKVMLNGWMRDKVKWGAWELVLYSSVIMHHWCDLWRAGPITSCIMWLWPCPGFYRYFGWHSARSVGLEVIAAQKGRDSLVVGLTSAEVCIFDLRWQSPGLHNLWHFPGLLHPA